MSLHKMSGLNPLDSLPNEILDAVFAALPTRALLPMTLVCRRFHDVATSTLKLRLLQTANLDRHDLVLECYPPSAKLSTPSLSCSYHGMGLLSNAPTSQKSPDDWELGELREVYSRFHPQQTRGWGSDGDQPKPTQDVFLDDSELFTQLCASTSIVKCGPRPGLYVAHNGIGDGVVRVWRDWLARVVADEYSAGKGDENVLWTDHRRNVGVRFSVCRTPEQQQAEPWLVSSEEPPVEYTLQYEEVLVRTSRVLLAMERSAIREGAHRGALVEVVAQRSLPVEAFIMSAIFPSHPTYLRPGTAVV